MGWYLNSSSACKTKIIPRSPIPQVAPELTRASETPDSLEIVLAGMAARREELFEYLSNLPPEAWQRPLHHAAWGVMKFYQVVNVLPQHDQQHAQQLANFKARLQEHNV